MMRVLPPLVGILQVGITIFATKIEQRQAGPVSLFRMSTVVQMPSYHGTSAAADALIPLDGGIRLMRVLALRKHLNFYPVS